MRELMIAAAVLGHGSFGAGQSAGSTIVSVLAVCGIGAAYGKGVQDLWIRRGAGAVISRRRALAFGAGLTTLAVAVSPPVHELADASFTGHMTQHMVILVVAGPLLGMGGAALPLTLALPRRARGSLARVRACSPAHWLRRPVNRVLIGGLIFTVVLWAWHLPRIYLWALHNDAVHGAAHVSYVLIAWILWSAVLTPDKHRINGPLGFLLLFAIGMTGAALGAVLTFAPVPLYPPEVFATGVSALTDQQLAGLVMWIPMDVVVMGLALGVFGRWLADLERRFPGSAPLPVAGGGAEVMSP